MSAPHGQGVAWVTVEDLDEQLKKAASQGAGAKDLVLYEFTADWCPPCQKRERNEFRSKPIIDDINSKFIPVRVDLTTREQTERVPVRQLTEKFDVGSIPRCVITLRSGEKVCDDHYMFEPDYLGFLKNAERDAGKVHAELDMSRGDNAGAIAKLDPELVSGQAIGYRSGLIDYVMCHHLLTILKRQAEIEPMMKKTLEKTIAQQKLNGNGENGPVKTLEALNSYLRGESDDKKLLDCARYDSDRSAYYLAIGLKDLRQEQKKPALKALHQASLYAAKAYQSDQLAEFLTRELE
jgi:thiol-disulfide isomerase/thioredoxin